MSQPHIVLITADQLRADALGCYGGQAVETPNLDRLAAGADRYTAAYTASPWCLPSRSSIVTGQYPHTHRAYSNFRDCRLDPATPNLYSLLGDQGYTTSHIGKCHYAPVPYSETRPDRTLPYDAFRDYYLSLGIDHLALQDDKQVSVWYADDYSRELDAAGYLEAYRAAVWNRDYAKVFPFPGPAAWHPDAWVGRKAAERIAGVDPAQPQFLWVSFSGPHFPFDAPDDYLDRVDSSQVGEATMVPGEFDDPARIHHTSYHGPKGIEGAGSAGGKGTSAYSDDYWTRLRTRYYANVALIDDAVGLVLDAITRHLGDDVLVIFTADHGEMLGSHRLWGKHSCGYEDVLRVPLLVRHPEQREGATVASRVQLIDLLPTCLAVAGSSYNRAEGRPLAPGVGHEGYRYVVAEGEGFLAISDGGATYISAMRDGVRLREVFDLVRDPGATRNAIDDPELAPRVMALHRAVEDLLLGALLP
jgi:arylsulfatase A-like enzyme